MTENITTDDTSRILSHEEMAGYGWMAHQDIADEGWTFVRYADPQIAADCIDDGDPVLENLCVEKDPLECFYLEAGQSPLGRAEPGRHRPRRPAPGDPGHDPDRPALLR